jgi:glyoxylase-like metal-dependent hydrolase (beta-lactamase superfamily II)
VLERSQGNLIVYNSPGVSASADAISELGEPARLLINHGHESIYGQPALDVPVWVHAKDRAAIAPSMEVTGTFDTRDMLDDDLEIIPTPGHTAGTTSYLWDDGRHRFLFTGDFIWIENGEWKAVVLDRNLRDDYLSSLELVRDLDFDVLVPWGTTEGHPSYGLVADAAEKRSRINAIIHRVKAGADR